MADHDSKVLPTIDELIDENIELLNQNAELRDELSAFKKQHRDLSVENMDLKGQLVKAQRQEEFFQSELISKVMEVEEKKEEIQDLNNQLSSLLDEISAQQAELIYYKELEILGLLDKSSIMQ